MEDWFLFFGSVSIALFTSAMCSLMEAAILSLTPSQIAKIRQRNPKIGDACQKLKSDIEKPIAVILMINTAAHTIGASMAGASLDAIFDGQYLWTFSLVFTLVMVQYTEILPKTIGVRYNCWVISKTVGVLKFLIIVLLPLIKLIHLINRPFEIKKNQNETNTAEEMFALASMARSSNIITSRQERIIRAVPKLSEQLAESIMIPTENISFLYADQSVSDAINISATDFHTRYPVCDAKDRLKVIGYVNFKEVVATSRSHAGIVSLIDILRPIARAEPDETAEELLERFATKHCHMTIVCDPKTKETLGLITLEDIIEELLGNLDDEFDPLPRTFYSPGENFWVVGGGVSMTQLSRDTHLLLPRRAEPCSSWFVNKLGRAPKSGDVVRYRNSEFYARKLRRGQVLEFNVKRASQIEERLIDEDEE